MTRVALFTSQDIGFELVEYFSGRADIDLLVIAYEKPKDAGYGYRSSLTLCKDNKLKFLDAPKPDATVASALDAHKPDIILSAYYARLLPMALLAKARLGGVNVHPGKLPFYKGRFPTPWYILNGESTFGIALHKMVDAVDAGDVFVQREFPIPADMTGHELLRATMARSAEVIIESFDGIVSGALTAVPQAPGGSRYDHIDPEYEIDWNASAETIVREIRVHAPPYKAAYSHTARGRLSINRATVVGSTGQPPGHIMQDQRDLIIACSEGAIRTSDYSFG